MDMKKIITCAALLAGIVFFNGRLNAQVESDIVGYTTVEMAAGKWYMVASPFVALDETTIPTLNDVFTTGFSNGDTASVWSTEMNQYTMYTWNATKGKWLTGSRPTAPEANVALTPGQAIFINKKTAGTVVVSGKVSTSEVVEFGSELGSAWSQIACVYPVTTKLNALNWEGLANGDTVSVWNSESDQYSMYTWNTTKGKWLTGSRPTSPEADVDLTPGQAVFINRKSAGIGSCSRAAE